VVLAIEDDESALDSFRLILEADYELLTATSATEALEILQSRSVDAVLLDLLLPGMDGLQILGELKAQHPGLDVIIISGLAQAQVVVAAMKVGAFEYLTKPFAEEDLLGLVSEAVHRRRSDLPTVLLLGEDSAILASLAVLLAAHVIVAMSAPRSDVLPDATSRIPLLVIYDSGAVSPLTSIVVERLHERYSCSPLFLLAPPDHHVSEVVRSHTVIVNKPYALDGLLQHIAVVAPGLRLRELSIRSARLGPHLLRLIDFVTHSYRTPLGVSDLAHAVGCSGDHLAHLVRDRLGMSLMGYLTEFRLEVARHLMTITDLTIEQIASDAGFSSASHLSRVFLERWLYRPGDYRRRLRVAGMWPPSPIRASWGAVAQAATTQSDYGFNTAVKRVRIRQKLRAGHLPQALPPSFLFGAGAFPLPRRSGVSEGTRCAGCDEPIKQGELMCDYTYPHGSVFAFHIECERIWNKERKGETNV